MRVVAYSVKPAEKKPLAIANHKKHEITLISNPLSADTILYAAGKDAIVVFTEDDVSAEVIDKLAGLGVKYIVTRSVSDAHIDLAATARHGIKTASVPIDAITGLKE